MCAAYGDATDKAIKQTVSRQSFVTILLTLSTVSSSTEVAGRPKRCNSSHDDLPRLNLACHLLTKQ